MVRVTILPIPSHGQDDRASEVSAASSEGTFRLGSAGAGEPSGEYLPSSADLSVTLPVLIISSHANSRT